MNEQLATPRSNEHLQKYLQISNLRKMHKSEILKLTFNVRTKNNVRIKPSYLRYPSTIVKTLKNCLQTVYQYNYRKKILINRLCKQFLDNLKIFTVDLTSLIIRTPTFSRNFSFVYEGRFKDAHNNCSLSLSLK